MTIRRELPGFGIPKEVYEIAEKNRVKEVQRGTFPTHGTLSQYLEACLISAVVIRERDLKTVDLSERRVLTPDELLRRG